MDTYRIIDANLNRVSEGIRVLEDIARFSNNNRIISEKLRNLRHRARKSFYCKELIISRDSSSDVGFEISAKSTLDNKSSKQELINANFKRVQEGFRSIEENLKVLGFYKEPKLYEELRYSSYELEKAFMNLYKRTINTDIYGILGEEFSKGRKNLDIVKEMLKADIKVIQYREKNKNKIDKYLECKEIMKIIDTTDALFVVNDDVDIAVSVGAHGIHLGQEDMPISEIRKIARDMMIGLSTHNSSQALKAIEAGADYIGVGPIFETQSKKNVEASEGLNYLKWVSEYINIPYVAIGGIKEANIKEVQSSGGKCFAMISEIVGSDDICSKVKSIRSILEKTT